MHLIQMKVGAVSDNTNSFGLRGHVLVSRTGLAVEVGLSGIHSRGLDTYAWIPVQREDLASGEAFACAVARTLSGEIPRALPKAPAPVVGELWGDEAYGKRNRRAA